MTHKVVMDAYKEQLLINFEIAGFQLPHYKLPEHL